VQIIGMAVRVCHARLRVARSLPVATRTIGCVRKKQRDENGQNENIVSQISDASMRSEQRLSR